MAGVVSSFAKVDFVNVSKAYPQPSFIPSKVSSVGFISTSKYSKGRIAATAEDKTDSGAHGIIDAAAKNASDMVDNAKELAGKAADQAQSNEDKRKESEDKVAKATKDAAESAAEAAEETVGGAWEAAKGTLFPKDDKKE